MWLSFTVPHPPSTPSRGVNSLSEISIGHIGAIMNMMSLQMLPASTCDEQHNNQHRMTTTTRTGRRQTGMKKSNISLPSLLALLAASVEASRLDVRAIALWLCLTLL